MLKCRGRFGPHRTVPAYPDPSNLGILRMDQSAERIFAALSTGGTVTMPFGPTFWASAFGMCVDRFGIGWMVNCSLPAEVPAGAA